MSFWHGNQLLSNLGGATIIVRGFVKELYQMEYKLRGGNWVLIGYLILKDEVIDKMVHGNRGRMCFVVYFASM